MNKVTALYGFSATLPPFEAKTPDEQVALLKSWGNTAIFGGHENPDFLAAAQAAGLSVYVEFGCFVGEHWWQRFPQSRPVIATGQLLEKEDWYCGVNPSTLEVRQAQLDALEKLLTDYAIDGVWLDFIRWPCHWEAPDPQRPQTSFDPGTLTRFSRETGIDLPGDDPAVAARLLLNRHQAAWTNWRCRQIIDWVAAAKRIVERLRPDAHLGLFGIPWRLADFDGAILKVVGQDYQALAEYVDVFSPMVYHLMCGQPPAWIDAVSREIADLTGKPVWPIIQAVDVPGRLSPQAYEEALTTALQSDATEGVLVFHLKGALEDARLAITQAQFNRIMS
jgi:hypothetical protein